MTEDWRDELYRFGEERTPSAAFPFSGKSRSQYIVHLIEGDHQATAERKKEVASLAASMLRLGCAFGDVCTLVRHELDLR